MLIFFHQNNELLIYNKLYCYGVVHALFVSTLNSCKCFFFPRVFVCCVRLFSHRCFANIQYSYICYMLICSILFDGWMVSAKLCVCVCAYHDIPLQLLCLFSFFCFVFHCIVLIIHFTSKQFNIHMIQVALMLCTSHLFVRNAKCDQVKYTMYTYINMRMCVSFFHCMCENS